MPFARLVTAGGKGYTRPVEEARFYERLEENKVRCRLCPHECLIHPGRVGICFARQNEDGRLAAAAYARVTGTALDPIEKKPLHFFHPGARILSVGTVGCNLVCPFCQNWQTAQPKDILRRQGIKPASIGSEAARRTIERMTVPMPVDRLVQLALEHQGSGNIGVAYTYNEPFIWFEYVWAAAKAVKAAGMKNILVTNGFVNERPLMELLPFIDAVNIDIKAFDESFYRRVGGRLATVLNTAKTAADFCHVEITNLLIPGLNTDNRQIEALTDWIADNLGPQTPLHLSRYFPARRFKQPATSLDQLSKAERIARRRLDRVCLGNI